MQPLVSIITVTRNLIDTGRKDFFRQCIESVRMQDYPNIEHLIIDGASTDGTVELLQELGINYISEPDKGISDAYNKGIRLAKGKYIAFLSDDDLYSSEQAVSSVIKILEERQADFSYAPFNVIDQSDCFVAFAAPFFLGFPLGMPFGYPTMFTKKTVLEQVGGHSLDYKICGDYDLVCRIILNGYKSVLIPKAFVSWRKGGVSDTQKEIVRQENIQVVSRNTGLTLKEAEKYYTRKYLPKKILWSLETKIADFPETFGSLLKHNRKQFFKYIRKQLLTVHLRKGKRCFRLFGITFYNEGKK
ncbi:MAG: glycosyltransferase [Alphaproteobacteria bacterium]|nr:glycosyltransferase [Alphaproteobacteria bacterium]